MNRARAARGVQVIRETLGGNVHKLQVTPTNTHRSCVGVCGKEGLASGKRKTRWEVQRGEGALKRKRMGVPKKTFTSMCTSLPTK